jgi:undecaprenyl-diphosphatase
MVDGVLQKIAYNDLIIASALIIGSVIMVLAEKSYGRGKKCLGVESLSVMQSLSIGLWQCLSFIPGMSRSMVTIVGGYRTGLCRVDAAEYSFLLGAMTLTAATGYKLLKDFSAIAACFSARTFFIGIGIAFTASLFAVKFLVAVISRRGLAPFALYRIPLAIFIVISAYA